MRRLLALLLLASLSSLAQSVAPKDASEHIGKTATVCGKVASSRYAERVNGQPTFLNLDEPHPRHIFTVVIWGRHRAAFGSPETLLGKSICVTGRVSEFKGKPQIQATQPEQIKEKLQ